MAQNTNFNKASQSGQHFQHKFLQHLMQKQTQKLKEHTCGLCSVRLVQGRIDSTQWFIVVWQNKTLTTTTQKKKIKGTRGKWLVIENVTTKNVFHHLFGTTKHSFKHSQ
jgi:hypothetical protein